jgi:predicted GTPase
MGGNDARTPNVSKMNDKQQLAFSIVIEHLRGDHPDLLKLIITGEGGTGKSYLINAALIMAPTGVAVFNVGGRTIHSVLMMGKSSPTIAIDKKKAAIFQKQLSGTS